MNSLKKDATALTIRPSRQDENLAIVDKRTLERWPRTTRLSMIQVNHS